MVDFAVVIPTYRRPAYVVDAINSALGQSYPAKEIIVVCDGPGSAIPTGSFDGRVQVVEQPKLGVAAARNKGVEMATAEWVCFLDDDDLWHPDLLQRMVEYLEGHPECEALTSVPVLFAAEPMPGIAFVATDLAGCLAATDDVAPPRDTAAFYEGMPGRSYDLLLEGGRGTIHGAAVRRSVLQRAGGFPVGPVFAEDWTMFVNVARYTEWHYFDAAMIYYRQHAQQTAGTARGNLDNELKKVRAIRAAWEDQERPIPEHRPLRDFSPIYRSMVQSFVWRAVRARTFGIAIQIYREAGPLLPSRADRLYTLIPRPLTYRWNRRRARRPAGAVVGG